VGSVEGTWGNTMAQKRFMQLLILLLILVVLPLFARAQPAPGGPPAVGIMRAERQQITETDEFIGRIQSIGRVALVARVTAFLEKRQFVEGAEVKKGEARDRFMRGRGRGPAVDA
jgi:membrane fusion protein (multidrug efflux system)